MDKADFTMEDLKDPERLKFLLMKSLGVTRGMSGMWMCRTKMEGL